MESVLSEGGDFLEQRRWIDPALDGTGGGFGKYKGLTVTEIARIFGQTIREPHMRSVSAILRIAYEQLEARSMLSGTAYAAIAMGVLTAVAGVVAFVFSTRPDASRFVSPILKGFGASSVLFICFAVGAFSSRRQAKAAAVQEKAIAELSIAALEAVVLAPGFRPGSLNSLQQQTLKRMVKRVGARSEPLNSLLGNN